MRNLEILCSSLFAWLPSSSTLFSAGTATTSQTSIHAETTEDARLPQATGRWRVTMSPSGSPNNVNRQGKNYQNYPPRVRHGRVYFLSTHTIKTGTARLYTTSQFDVGINIAPCDQTIPAHLFVLIHDASRQFGHYSTACTRERKATVLEHLSVGSLGLDPPQGFHRHQNLTKNKPSPRSRQRRTLQERARPPRRLSVGWTTTQQSGVLGSALAERAGWRWKT